MTDRWRSSQKALQARQPEACSQLANLRSYTMHRLGYANPHKTSAWVTPIYHRYLCFLSYQLSTLDQTKKLVLTAQYMRFDLEHPQRSWAPANHGIADRKLWYSPKLWLMAGDIGGWPIDLCIPTCVPHRHEHHSFNTPNMKYPRLRPPRAPPDHLRLQSFQILSRLELIPQFRPWLDFTQYHVYRKHHTPLELLWDCFSFGAPLGTILTLLGSPAPNHLAQHVEDFDFGIGIEEREIYLMSLIQRVQLLEMQGRLPYGEVLRCEDFLSGSSSAFAKVRLRIAYSSLPILVLSKGPSNGIQAFVFSTGIISWIIRCVIWITGKTFRVDARTSKDRAGSFDYLACRGGMFDHHEALRYNRVLNTVLSDCGDLPRRGLEICAAFSGMLLSPPYTAYSISRTPSEVYARHHIGGSWCPTQMESHVFARRMFFIFLLWGDDISDLMGIERCDQ